MPGELRTRRWNDPVQADDGTRILITRFRPRGVKKAAETWQEWWTALAPSPELLHAFQGKDQPAIDFPEYRRRYLEEMSAAKSRFHLAALIGKLAAGDNVTLLCSSSCTDPARCHRSVLAELVKRGAKP